MIHGLVAAAKISGSPTIRGQFIRHDAGARVGRLMQCGAERLAGDGLHRARVNVAIRFDQCQYGSFGCSPSALADFTRTRTRISANVCLIDLNLPFK